MHVFIQVLAKELIIVCTDWAKVLDGMDEKLGATVTDLLDDQIGHQLMFDDKQFERSKLYFTSQQLCRVFKKYIEGTLLDLQQSQENFFWKWNGHLQETNVEHDLKVLKVHWTEAMAKPRTMFESLLTRVKDKQEEVESLRDGLFNATSVREASRGTELAQISFQQNQYLFVFTIMTVIYLPLGFVTSIFGMHLFDTTDPNVVDARPKFYTTLVVLSVSTYVAAGLAFWLVRNNKKGSGDDAAPRKKEEKTVVNPIKVKQGDGKTKGGIFASMRKRNGTGNGKGKGKEINSNVEVV
ncbi:hypothetical protein BKA65DRAFT_95815 [Rhexocercosporidium sp. MPI-PUGE-AT-0058]|nr:hypothetical protein BKA65DRAFT_95815 [Rhexocercosporidium sp. MPI-PUGE-AT-0058]